MINTRGSEVIQKLLHNELKREINDVAYNKYLNQGLVMYLTKEDSYIQISWKDE
ncbi:hypothetical protein [Clostridioides difficile]|uniref:hypothetical protein n=1 Tax=Clostridioides difficile TaxID=1496 RepID=UPI0010B04A10|nr:hypothetical protein [Clostridioides difficile]MCJ0310944.1 hypothetical protein [Clostridioides difficile]MCJ0378222.1 hypothetical protein [Clostridioides difficile]MCJ0412138.1 hypothetical protein [Clostridioides difficile]MCO8701877.1 hypothetical protein [Clostridioides difficile]MCP8652490.1 hypothetical protein [Clostridioides difficile]